MDADAAYVDGLDKPIRGAGAAACNLSRVCSLPPFSTAPSPESIFGRVKEKLNFADFLTQSASSRKLSSESNYQPTPGRKSSALSVIFEDSRNQ